jgi:hypothetical protein
VRRQLALAVVLACVAGRAAAQDQPKVGLAMGYPASVSVLWRMTDRVALRPEFAVSHTSAESTSDSVGGVPVPGTDNDGTGVGVGVSGLFYVGRWDALRTYVSPRFVYSRSTTSASTAAEQPGGESTLDSTRSSYEGSGSFGAEYVIGRRFGVFGEVGLDYAYSSTSGVSRYPATVVSIVNGTLVQSTAQRTLNSRSRSNTLSTRSSVGVIFFF